MICAFYFPLHEVVYYSTTSFNKMQIKALFAIIRPIITFSKGSEKRNSKEVNMKNMSVGKYRPYPQVDLPNRIWPTKTITHAPIWCSVDLRDGNQALITPMNLEQKINLFSLLLKLGFKNIEVGFPSASKVEFDFL